jgi:hypothetical protein
MIIEMTISTAGSPDSDSPSTDRFLPYTLSLSLGHPDVESGDVIEADVLSHGVHRFSTLYSQYETGFSARRAKR